MITEQSFTLENINLGNWQINNLKEYLKKHKNKIELNCLADLSNFEPKELERLNKTVKEYFEVSFGYNGEIIIYLISKECLE